MEEPKDAVHARDLAGGSSSSVEQEKVARDADVTPPTTMEHAKGAAPDVAHPCETEARQPKESPSTVPEQIDPVDPPATGTQSTPGGIRWNEHKAGLQGVDKAKIQEIVTAASKGSKFYLREQAKAAELSARIAVFRKEVDAARLQPDRLAARLVEVNDVIIPSLELERVSGRVICVIDFDSYFSSVEALDDPTLVGVPHAVGAGSGGVLATASYEARRFGVRSAMATFIAKKLCPHLHIVPPRMSRYKEISRKVEEEVFAHYDPGYRMGSLDEAFLDLTPLVTPERPAEVVVRELRERIREVTGGLTTSAGVGPNRLIAKISADMNKPDGQTVILPDDERKGLMEFMKPLPLRKVPFVGRVLEAWLVDGIGLKCVGDVLKERALVAEVMSGRTVHFLLRSALGIGSAFTAVDGEEESVRKGMSRQRSFSPQKDEAKLMEILHNVCVMLEQDVVKNGVGGARTVVLKLKTSGFVSLSRSVTVKGNGYVSTAAEFEAYGRRLLKGELPMELRLVGIGLQKLWFKGEEGAAEPKNSIKKFLKKEEGNGNGNGESPASVSLKSSGSQALLQMRSLSGKMGGRKRSRNMFKMKVKEAECGACTAKSEGGSPDHLQEYVCPVCNSRCFKELGELNRHMDECLNVTSEVFKEAVREQNRGGRVDVRPDKKIRTG